MPFSAGQLIGQSVAFPAIGDFNNDGLLEPFGFLNQGDWTFSLTPSLALDIIVAGYPGRVNRDNRVLDLDGDGNLDVFWNVYSDATATGSFTLILFGDGAGGFSRVEERPDIIGFGETIVAADFNNDGLVDLYSPVYTHLLGVDSGYLLFNEGGGVLGDNVAEDWNIALSNLPAQYRVEGAQGADVNFDGWIDIYVGSHLFLNQGDHFLAQPLSTFLFEEGANLVDFDNDGDFDLVLRPLNLGPQLLENVDGVFVDRGVLTGSEFVGGYGSNVGDLDGNGWQDIIIGGPGMISIFMNYEGVFERLDIAAAGSTDFEAMALADLNGDGALDIVGRADNDVYVFWNEFTQGDVVTFSVLGENGEENQFGRSLRLTPREQSELVLARVVDSGSGYLSQGQYDLVVGLPIGGAYDAEVALATGMLRFVISANQHVTTFADGRVSIVGSGDADTMGGASGDDVLTSAGGDDLILGSLGADAIDGGTGRDIVDFSEVAGGIVADLAAGTALVGGEAQTLAGIEGLIGTSDDDQLHGDAADNELTGGDGDDLLDGGAGADILRGGLGNDVYIVDSALDDIAEASGEGDDEVQTSLASYVLGAGFESLTGTSSGGQSLTGNDAANLIQGGAGADTFTGGLGDDTYVVGDADGVVELADGGFDTVRTNLASYALADNVEDLIGLAVSGQALTGNSLGNRISGGAGADTFAGAGGDDVYTVGAGDIVVEATGEGVDEVRTALATYTLTENVRS